MASGVRTVTLNPSPIVDELIGNSGSNTVKISVSSLLKLMPSEVSGPTYQTLSELAADLNWEAGLVGLVYGDDDLTKRGLYRKSGDRGAGEWLWYADPPAFAQALAQTEADSRQALAARDVALGASGEASAIASRVQGQSVGNVVGREFFRDGNVDPFLGGTAVAVSGHPNGALMGMRQTVRDNITASISGDIRGRTYRFTGVVDASASPYTAMVGFKLTNGSQYRFPLKAVASAGDAVKSFSVTVVVPDVDWTPTSWNIMLVSVGAGSAVDHDLTWSQIRVEDVTSEAAAFTAMSLALPPYASRAVAEATVIPDTVAIIALRHAGTVLYYQRDSAGTALNTADGGHWSPIGDATFEHWGAVGDGVDNCEKTNFRYDWSTATEYAEGDRIQAPVHRRGYVCKSAHTSGTFETDLANGNWEIGTFSGTDDRAACEAALQSGHVIYLRAGRRYRWAEHPDNAATPTTPFVDLSATHPDIHIVGTDDAWIFLDEDCEARIASGNGYASFGIDTGKMATPERGKYGICRFENLNVRSRWTHYPGTHNASEHNGSGYNWCRIEGYKLFEAIGGIYEDFRQKLSRNRHNAKVRIVNTSGYRLAKGMWREVNSTDVIAHGNMIDGSGDDTLDFIHVESDPSNQQQAVGSFCSISNNIIKQGQNIQSQGFSQIIISQNILDRMFENAITASVGQTEANDRPRTALTIIDNVISNTIMPYQESTNSLKASDDNAAILVRGGRISKATTAAAPGTYDSATKLFVQPYAHMQTVRRSFSESSAGGYLNRADGNTIINTLPDDVEYSDWKEGWMFSPWGYVNPTVAAENRISHGVMFANDINGASMSRNHTLGIQFPIFLLETNSEDPQRAFDNILVDGNICIDCVEGFSHSKAAGGVKYRWGVTVTNNQFDVDPFHKSPNRTHPLNGSWLAGVSILAAECGIQARNLPNLVAHHNRFRNCYYPISSNAAGTPGHDVALFGNVVECEPVSPSYSASNLGVAVPGTGAEFSHVVIDADPASGTYGTVVNQPKAANSAAPTSGTYVQGHLVRDASGSSLGWRRATTGAGHVVGTDWIKVG